MWPLWGGQQKSGSECGDASMAVLTFGFDLGCHSIINASPTQITILVWIKPYKHQNISNSSLAHIFLNHIFCSQKVDLFNGRNRLFYILQSFLRVTDGDYLAIHFLLASHPACLNCGGQSSSRESTQWKWERDLLAYFVHLQPLELWILKKGKI